MVVFHWLAVLVEATKRTPKLLNRDQFSKFCNCVDRFKNSRGKCMCGLVLLKGQKSKPPSLEESTSH